MSEKRQRLNELLGVEDRNDEQGAELEKLTDEVQKLEPELRAALAAEPEARTVDPPAETAEERELREIRGRFQGAGEFVQAAVKGVGVTGAALEYAQALGVPAGEMPLSLLGRIDRPEEHRAVTPGTTEDADGPIVGYIFERTVCEALVPGCIRPAGPGVYHAVTMTTAPTAAVRAKDADAPNTAGAFALAERSPVRVTGQVEFRMEDSYVLPGMESSLQGALASLIASQVDETVVTGKASNPDFDGLFDLATDVARPSADQNYGAVRSAILGHVDGQYAYGPGDLRVAIGSFSYAKLEGLYQSNGDRSAYEALMDKLGVLRVSDRMPAATNSNTSQKGLIVLAGGGADMRLEVPVWNRMELIRDQYTAAKKGQVVLTAAAYIGAPIIRFGTSVLKELHFRFA